jgi:hypothetical protein
MLEPAPSERAQLSARSELLKNLRSLLDDLNKRFDRRKAQLNNFGTESFGMIGHSIYIEALIHMSTLNVVTRDLSVEYMRFVETEPLSEIGLLFDAAALMNNEIVKSLRDCVTLMGVNEGEQYRKLALTIMSNGAKLSGLGTPVAIFEIVNAIKDITETSGVEHDDERKAGNFLLKIELFMMLSLSAALFATAVVRVRTSTDSIGEKPDAASDMKAAREFVTKRLLTTRAIFEKTETMPLLCFPEAGMWSENLDTKDSDTDAVV